MTCRCKVEFQAGIVIVTPESGSFDRVCPIGRVTQEAASRRPAVNARNLGHQDSWVAGVEWTHSPPGLARRGRASTLDPGHPRFQEAQGKRHNLSKQRNFKTSRRAGAPFSSAHVLGIHRATNYCRRPTTRRGFPTTSLLLCCRRSAARTSGCGRPAARSATIAARYRRVRSTWPGTALLRRRACS